MCIACQMHHGQLLFMLLLLVMLGLTLGLSW